MGVTRGGGKETTAKKVIMHSPEAMTESRFLGRKIGWHHQLPPTVTPTLVTPLQIFTSFLMRAYMSQPQTAKRCYVSLYGAVRLAWRFGI